MKGEYPIRGRVTQLRVDILRILARKMATTFSTPQFTIVRIFGWVLSAFFVPHEIMICYVPAVILVMHRLSGLDYSCHQVYLPEGVEEAPLFGMACLVFLAFDV